MRRYVSSLCALCSWALLLPAPASALAEDKDNGAPAQNKKGQKKEAAGPQDKERKIVQIRDEEIARPREKGNVFSDQKSSPESKDKVHTAAPEEKKPAPKASSGAAAGAEKTPQPKEKAYSAAKAEEKPALPTKTDAAAQASQAPTPVEKGDDETKNGASAPRTDKSPTKPAAADARATPDENKAPRNHVQSTPPAETEARAAAETEVPPERARKPQPPPSQTGQQVEGVPRIDKPTATNAPLLWAGIGATAVTGVVAGVFWGLAASRHANLEQHNTAIEQMYDNDPNLDEALAAAEDTSEKVDRYQKLGVGFTIAAVLSAAGTIWLFTSGTKGKESGQANVAILPDGIEVRY